MAEHSNVELIRQGFEAFAQGDMATLSQLMAPDATWHSATGGQVGGDYHGQEEIFGTFAATQELSGGTFRQEIHDILANDDHAVALVRSSAERGGATLDMNTVLVFHVRDGQVTEGWVIPEDGRASDMFWS